MTAAARRDLAPHPLARGASPAVVKAWLLPHDADRFRADYEVALDDARASLELARVVEVVEPVGEDVAVSIGALPPELLAPFAELRAALEVAPKTVGNPLVKRRPRANSRFRSTDHGCSTRQHAART